MTAAASQFRRVGRRLLAAGLFAAALLLLSAHGAWAREPVVRKLNKSKEPLVATRIEARRALLPARFRERNNYAWAVFRIEGVKEHEFIAHSGIQDVNDIPVECVIPEGLLCFRPQPGRYHFKPQAVNEMNVIDGPNSWFRHIDTEFKMLERLADLIPSTNATGRIHMFTQLHPCASCYQVMCDFLDRYPNIDMQVLYYDPYP